MKTETLFKQLDALETKAKEVNKLPILSRPAAAMDVVEASFDLTRNMIAHMAANEPYLDEDATKLLGGTSE